MSLIKPLKTVYLKSSPILGSMNVPLFNYSQKCMDSILYEHPLNERIRHYLKLEQLFAQVNHCVDEDIHTCQHVFFHAFFAILDSLERSDIRGVLIKDLEKLQQNLVVWSKSPDIDNDMLEFNLRETVKLLAHLKAIKPIWQDLKDDKLLSGLKQRFAIQGGIIRRIFIKF